LIPDEERFSVIPDKIPGLAPHPRHTPLIRQYLSRPSSPVPPFLDEGCRSCIGQLCCFFIGQFRDEPAMGYIVRICRHEPFGVFPDFQYFGMDGGCNNGGRIIRSTPAKSCDLSGFADPKKISFKSLENYGEFL